MMKRIILFLFVLFCWMPQAFSQKSEGIQWKNWSELEHALQEHPKPVLIFFYADWCAYCKKIEREVFTKQEVIHKINSDYYAVEMNVETTDTITFDNIKFINEQSLTQRNGVHQIPLILASRETQPFYLPATILLNPDFSVEKRVFEYYTSKHLLHML